MFQAGPLAIIASLGVISKVVLVVLLGFSIISWAIIFYKWATFRAVDLKDRHFMAVLLRARDVEEVTRNLPQAAGSPCAKIFHSVIQRLDQIPTTFSDGGSMVFDRHVMERTAAHLAQGQISKLESYLPFLATTGNICPFIGLLGTVLGIIDAFREIGTQGTASIAAVAPGVSEALIATAAGLFAAIPAVIAYNYFLTRIRRIALQMDSVVVELLALIPAQNRPTGSVPAGVKG
ncbi:MAG: MotA/TolQ/ExbB proton channel family protein [Nitrospira sp.]|nr:MotA/TolQ/ExbB proton channel family protein [Nitrospira sp.]